MARKVFSLQNMRLKSTFFAFHIHPSYLVEKLHNIFIFFYTFFGKSFAYLLAAGSRGWPPDDGMTSTHILSKFTIKLRNFEANPKPDRVRYFYD